MKREIKTGTAGGRRHTQAGGAQAKSAGAAERHTEADIEAQAQRAVRRKDNNPQSQESVKSHKRSSVTSMLHVLKKAGPAGRP